MSREIVPPFEILASQAGSLEHFSLFQYGY